MEQRTSRQEKALVTLASEIEELFDNELKAKGWVSVEQILDALSLARARPLYENIAPPIMQAPFMLIAFCTISPWTYLSAGAVNEALAHLVKNFKLKSQQRADPLLKGQRESVTVTKWKRAG